jgi:hypothetical protein
MVDFLASLKGEEGEGGGTRESAPGGPTEQGG